MTTQRHVLCDAASNRYVASLRLDDPHRRWCVKKFRLQCGLSEGVDVVEVRAGDVEFAVLPTRGMGLWRANIAGLPIGWNSPVAGPVHPRYINLGDSSGVGFLDGSCELMFRCGLESMGAPDFDARGVVRYPLHGRIANLPAHYLEIVIDEDAQAIRVRGTVAERRFLRQKLDLEVEYVVTLDQPAIRWTDRVVNRSATAAEMQMLYHVNFGEPLLVPGARLLAPIAEGCPRDEVAAATEAGDWPLYPSAEADYDEQVYFYRLLGDADGQSLVMLQTQADVAIALRFNVGDLPCFTQWKNTQAPEDGYVTGLEPGTAFPNPRTFEAEQGRVCRLEPHACWQATLELTALCDAESIRHVANEIAHLQGRQSPSLSSEPLSGWSPASSH